MTGDYRSRLKIESTAPKDGGLALVFLINDLSTRYEYQNETEFFGGNFRLHAEEGEETFDVVRSALRKIYARNSRNERVEISGSK